MIRFQLSLWWACLLLLGAVPAQSAEPEQPQPGHNEATFEGLEWRGIGPAPRSGRIADIAVDPVGSGRISDDILPALRRDLDAAGVPAGN